MLSITKDYLIEIIERIVRNNIHVRRRNSNDPYFQHEGISRPVTEEEIVEFILLIPHFDERLKDFMLGNISDRNTIISQAWEIEFIKKCTAWSESFTWLSGNNSITDRTAFHSLTGNIGNVLTLPY